MKTQQTPDKYTLGPDCDSGCLDQGVRVCGHEFSMKHHLDDCKQTETQRKPDPASPIPPHSPLPWRNNGGQIECETGFPHVIAHVGIVNAQGGIDTANARHIVRACNEYETLKDQRDHWCDMHTVAASRRDQAEAHAQRLADALRNLEAELQMAFDDVPAGVDAWMATARQALAQWNEGK